MNSSNFGGRQGMFWRICAVWALLLGSFWVVRPHLFRATMRAVEQRTPSSTEQLQIPRSVLTISGTRIQTLSRDRPTFFLVTSAGCPACKRELPTYGDQLEMAKREGLEIRMLVIPGTSQETEWYLERVPLGVPVVLDTMRLAISNLRSGLTPSIVMVRPDGTVIDSFSPPVDWPVTARMISRRLE